MRYPKPGESFVPEGASRDEIVLMSLDEEELEMLEEMAPSFMREVHRRREELAKARALIQRWRFESHGGECWCKKCKATAALFPDLPYYPDETTTA